MVRQPEIHLDLDELNHTELVGLARWCGIDASRGWPRKYLMYALENFEALEAPDPAGEAKEKMSNWLKLHWDRVQMQAPKKVCPECHLCSDLQALECFTINQRNIEGQ